MASACAMLNQPGQSAHFLNGATFDMIYSLNRALVGWDWCQEQVSVLSAFNLSKLVLLFMLEEQAWLMVTLGG